MNRSDQYMNYMDSFYKLEFHAILRYYLLTYIHRWDRWL